MTLQQLKYALTIADCGSMNEAAKTLFLSQPSLSETIRELETEIGFELFVRSNRGILVTPEGEEFLGYARQVTEQFTLLTSRYIDKQVKEKFSVSMQHYTFAVKAFVETVKQAGMEQYEFAVHETTTYDVLENVKNFRSEIGVLYLNDFNEKVMNKIIREHGLEFIELFSCDTYVYLWSGHPLAKQEVISMEELDAYPCLSFDQGEHHSLYLAEEMKSTYDYKRLIKANDRATLLNLMIGLNAYTLCSGIICEELNGSDYMAIPLKETEKMRIGYVKRKGAKVSHIGEIYIEELKKYIGEYDEKRVRFLVAQECEDEISDALDVIADLADYVGSFKREPISCSELVIGMKCGGSDGLSGITANPTVGAFSDLLISKGGTTVLTEVPEMFGAETLLMNRCENEKLFDETRSEEHTSELQSHA